MGLHLRPGADVSPLMDTASYVLGMPHLCPNGLSENWLWKELGHRHWMLIAQAYGVAATGFGPVGEQPVYAAFRKISLQDGDLCSVVENDTLDVRSTVLHLSEIQVVSRHVVACRDRLIANVEMSSVFVRRRTEGLNRSIARVRIEGGRRNEELLSRETFETVGCGQEFAGDVKHEDEQELSTKIIEVCPHLDFNGAGLLYFSSFIAAVDRAEWSLLKKRSHRFTSLKRQAVFNGNIEVGDNLKVCILASRDEAPYRHRALLYASSDGKPLSEVLTYRMPKEFYS